MYSACELNYEMQVGYGFSLNMACLPGCRDNKTKADNKDDADYDVAARELAFEGKGAAVDRTLGPEEFADRERQVAWRYSGPWPPPLT